MKNLVILGCSYTHWWDGKCFNKSYPALIARDYPEYHVWDMSEPGGSNDTIYLRLRFLERHYNVVPDKIIIQWTTLSRTNINLNWKNGFNPKIKDYRTSKDWKAGTGQVIEREDLDIEPWNITQITEELLDQSPPNYSWHPETEWPIDSITVNPGLIRLDTNKYHKKLIKKLYQHSKVGLHQLRNFYSWYLGSTTNLWAVQKEIDLVTAKYGVDNIMSFDWRNHWSPSFHPSIEMASHNVGCVAHAFRKKNKFMELGVDDAPHYGEEGHAEVYKWLTPHIRKLLNADN